MFPYIGYLPVQQEKRDSGALDGLCNVRSNWFSCCAVDAGLVYPDIPGIKPWVTSRDTGDRCHQRFFPKMSNVAKRQSSFLWTSGREWLGCFSAHPLWKPRPVVHWGVSLPRHYRCAVAWLVLVRVLLGGLNCIRSIPRTGSRRASTENRDFQEEVLG